MSLTRFERAVLYTVLVGICMPAMAQWRAARFEHISTKDGLTNDKVNTIIQDQRGYMWFGTESGVSRYDGLNIRPYYHDSTDPNSLSSSNISCLYEDPDGVLWVGTQNGLNRYVPEYDRFERFSANDISFESRLIKSILKSSNGDFWIGTYGSGLYLQRRGENTLIKFKHSNDDPGSLQSNGVTKVFEDLQGNIWVGTYAGLDFYVPESNSFVHFSDQNGIAPGLVISLTEDKNGILWVASLKGLAYQEPGTMSFKTVELGLQNVNGLASCSNGSLMISNDGLVLYDPVTQERIDISHSQADPYSLCSNETLSVFQDRDGVVWVGSASDGLSKFDIRQLRFRNYQKKVGPGAIGTSYICILETRAGGFLVGTGQGLDRLERKKGAITPIPLEDKKGNKEFIIFMCQEDEKGGLWVATNKGLAYLLDDKTTWFNASKEDPMGLSFDVIQSLIYDSKRRLWVGTDFGLDLLLPGGKEIFHFNSELDNTKSPRGSIYYLHEDSDGVIWVGSNIGLSSLEMESNKFTNYSSGDSKINSLTNDLITCIEEGQDKSIWVGTSDGLNRLNPLRTEFTAVRVQDGLASNFICGVIADDQGQIWVSTDRGITRINPTDGTMHSLDVYDGLQSNSFTPGSILKSSKGELFFGGKNGLTSFFPSDIERDTRIPQIEITSFMIFNKEMRPRYLDPDSPIEKVIGATEKISLDYKKNMIQFSFAVMQYSNPSKNKYAYLMEGLDNEWVTVDAEKPYASFANIGAGTYNFRVKGANNHGTWNNEGKKIVIVMRPAPWLSPLAYTIYSLIVLLIVVAYIREQNRKLEQQRSINQQQTKVNERLRNLDRFKDEILANTSHELRTPLNGIIGLADSLRDGSAGNLTEAARKDLSTIVSCGKRLSSLINDILDYSRMKKATLQLNRNAVDLHQVAQIVLKLSQPLLGRKEIKLLEAIPHDLPTIQADENRLMQILHNLVGNAVKFTEKGYVKVSAQLQGDHVLVSVSDTGIGIPEDKLGQIFEAFEQGDSSAIRTFGGTGLGLAITKHLVAMHGGEITVNSVQGAGSTFSFSLSVSGGTAHALEAPLSERVFIADVEPDEDFGEPLVTLQASVPVQNISGRGSILVVDDEPVNRKVLLNYLTPQGYRLLEASGGAEALRLLSEDENIDLILLDIMMPRMSGYEVCRRIREIYNVNELPVIFLSAKNQTSDLLEGFVVGGNDYLSKPITKAELLARVNTHLELLDVNRNLEQKVKERTFELEEKNNKIMEQKEELIRKQRQLVIQEKMASLGTLTAGIAHEINNPVNFAHGSVQNLVVDLEKFREFFFELAGADADEEIVTAFQDKMLPLFTHSDTIMEGTKRISAIVKELQTFSRMDEADIKQVELVDGIISTLALVKANFSDRVQFMTRFDDPLIIECWPAEMNQVFMNLVVNGCQAIVRKQEENGMNAGETLTISTYIEDNCAVIRFQDEGCGIDIEERPRIFEPFFTTKPVGQGTGLGLSISYEIVTKHKGRLEVTSTLNVGTTMTIFIPLGVKVEEGNS